MYIDTLRRENYNNFAIKIGEIQNLGGQRRKVMSSVEEGMKLGQRAIDIAEKLLTPRIIKKQADAEIYALQRKADFIRDNPDMEIVSDGASMSLRYRENMNLSERAKQRMLLEAEKEQANLENIIELAAQELDAEEKAPDKLIADEWLTRFSKMARDVGAEEMQIIWSKILAGEIMQPGRFSLRTLNTISNLTKDEAELFLYITPYLLCNGSTWFLPAFQSSLEKVEIYYAMIASLDECGLINSQCVTFNRNTESGEFEFYTDNGMIRINSRQVQSNNPLLINQPVNVPGYVLTKVGNELFSIITHSFNSTFLGEFCEALRMYNGLHEFDIKYYEVKCCQNGQFQFEDEPFMSM